MCCICPVCGFSYEQPYLEEFGNSWRVSCPCCRFDVSANTYNKLGFILNYRNDWRTWVYNTPWQDRKQQPEKWDFRKQLEQIPEQYNREHALRLFKFDVDSRSKKLFHFSECGSICYWTSSYE